ncbi:MAG: hypothetical protein ACNA7Q_06370 [Rhodobacterales bacterium]
MIQAIRAILPGAGLWVLVACAPVGQMDNAVVDTAGGAPQAAPGQTGVTLSGSARIGVTRTFN